MKVESIFKKVTGTTVPSQSTTGGRKVTDFKKGLKSSFVKKSEKSFPSGQKIGKNGEATIFPEFTAERIRFCDFMRKSSSSL